MVIDLAHASPQMVRDVLRSLGARLGRRQGRRGRVEGPAQAGAEADRVVQLLRGRHVRVDQV